MSSSEIDPETEKYQLAPLRKEIHELTAKREILDQSVQRLAGDAFNNGPLAVQNINRIAAKRGAQTVCDVLDSKGLHDRVSIGFRRGSWLKPGSIDQANAAIEALKTAIRDRADIDAKIKDRIEAYERLAGRALVPGTPTDPGSGAPGAPVGNADARPWWRSTKPKPDDDDQSASNERERRWDRDR